VQHAVDRDLVVADEMDFFGRHKGDGTADVAVSPSMSV
jgi:hypothetical protein